MNEYIFRLAIVVICVISIAAVAAFVIIGINSQESVAVSANADEELTETVYSELTEETSVSVETDNEVMLEDTSENTEITTVSANEQESAASSSRTVITSRARKEYGDGSVYIDMENILQMPELPVGCEITALTILLRYYGFDADKCAMASDYLPKGGNAQYIDGELYKDSFFDYFIGDPFSRGYGCFSNAIEKAANKYIADNGGGYTVLNISGAHPDELYDYLANDIPVLCWATDGMIEPEYYESWYDNATGEKLDWYLNEHCFVLAGFNMKNDTVTLNDPMKGIIDYNINKFETRYAEMHSQAIVILKDDDFAETAMTVESSDNNNDEASDAETQD